MIQKNTPPSACLPRTGQGGGEAGLLGWNNLMNKPFPFLKSAKRERAMWMGKQGGADVTEDKFTVAA